MPPKNKRNEAEREITKPQTASGGAAATVVASENGLPKRILVVEDEKMIREIYCRVLTRSGYEVDTAQDGDAGWKVLQSASYDLLITDNNMPKVTGVELVRKIRSARLDLPVILATAAIPRYTEPLHLAAILSKPFGPAELLQTVKAALGTPVRRGEAVKFQEFSRRLLAHEAASGKSSGGNDSTAFRVCGKLSGTLGKLIGLGGFSSLMARALRLSGREVPWLLTFKIGPAGLLEGLKEIEAALDPRAVVEGEVILVSHLIELLTTFIGATLTLQLVREIWPKMKDLNFEEETYEEE